MNVFTKNRLKPLNKDIEISPTGRPFIRTEVLVNRLLSKQKKTEITVMELWEILVPKADENGDIAIPEHNIWDAKVRAITGGLTIHRSALGNWISPKGELIVERMIPVRIACTEEDIHKIGRMTKDFYRQEKVMYYRVSDMVFII